MIAVPAHLVTRFARDWHALVGDDADARAMVALSGGPDSSALLLLLRGAIGDRCSAATVDHRLRAGSAAEAAAAARLCAAQGIDHAILTGDMPDRVEGSANLSARARALRYRLIEAHAAAAGIRWIATGHHADDQRETIVMRLNRGAGLAGLAGIRAIGGRVVRPLLDWRRDELAALVSAAGIVAVADPSNADDRFDRARLRPSIAAADWLDPVGIGRSARALADAEQALAWSARQVIAMRADVCDDGVRLDIAALPFDLVRRATLLALGMLDAASPPPTGPALVRFCEALAAGRKVTLGTIVATPIGSVWHFRPAPPRRTL